MEGTTQKNLVKRRGIVFLYGFEWCNPNGDPSFENEPRIYEGRVYVTDVFLKRRIRDYIDSLSKNKDKSKSKDKRKDKGYVIFVKEDLKEDGTRKTPEERVKEILGKNADNIKDLESLLEKCWDLRVFGCMIPLPQKESQKGTSFKRIGPVQVSFGISLNNIESFDVTITNVMASKEEKATGGSIGRKYVVPVAIVEHYIFINDRAAVETQMTEDDYELFLEALKNLKLSPSASTSSKNITPLLILEVIFDDDKYVNPFGLINVKERRSPPISIRDFEIDTLNLFNKINTLLQNKIINSYTLYVKEEFVDIFKLPEGIDSKKF